MAEQSVEYVTHSGDDLLVVDAARVSFDKKSEWEEYDDIELEDNILFGVIPFKVRKKRLSDKDQKLIKYLATHGHFTPFTHPQVTLRVSAPIFVARQLMKHQVGLTVNEQSRRYVDDSPEFYMPSEWRGRPVNGMKQGSSGEIESEWMTPDYEELLKYAKDFYTLLVEHQVAPEMARMVLPQAMMTQWFWTGSLSAFARVCKLRLDEHAQKETRDVAEMIASIIEPLYPVSFKALMDN